jgi:hypothetical protein
MLKEQSVLKVSAHLKENEWVFISGMPHFKVVIQHWQFFIKKLSMIPSGYKKIYLLEIWGKTK